MSQWIISGKVGRPPYKDHRNRGNSISSISTINSSSTQESVELKPSRFYNNSYIDTERRNNTIKIEEQNEVLRKDEQNKKQGGLAGLAKVFENNCSQWTKSNSKEEAIRNWEFRQQLKKDDNGLFLKMDQRGIYNTGRNQFKGWGKERKPKEIVRTIYLPARNTDQQGRVSRAGTDLPPYEVTDTRLYPVCPSPDTEDELQKLSNWIEYKSGDEYSVDKPRVVQKRRTSSLRTSSLGMGTLFEGYDDNDSYIDSDEINLQVMCSEYDGDYSTDDEEAQLKMDSHISEAEAARRQTSCFNLPPPLGRRCRKQSYGKSQADNSYQNTDSDYVTQPQALRLRGGAKSSSSEMEVVVDSGATNSQTGQTILEQTTSKRTHGQSPSRDLCNTPTNPTKICKVQLTSPGTPKNDMEKTSQYQRRARELTTYFERFKTTTKKKLTATNNSELDKGVELLNDLVTELCLENIHHVGRYTELKRMYDGLEENKKRVDFASPLPLPIPRSVRAVDDNFTTDTETEQSKKTKKPKKKKKKSQTATSNVEFSAPASSSRRNNTETDGATSGNDKPRPKSLTSGSKKKKEKEKEILEKCRDQVAPVKFIVTTGDKSTEETKKFLWTQVVSKNRAPKIKDSVTL